MSGAFGWVHDALEAAGNFLSLIIGVTPITGGTPGDHLIVGPSGELEQASGGSGRIIVPDNTTLDYYVATTGSDSSGDGSVGNPWATIQHAVQYVADNLYNDTPNSAFVNINVAAGTYTQPNSNPLVLPNIYPTGQLGLYNFINIIGDTTTPANVVINCGAGYSNTDLVQNYGDVWWLHGFTFDASAAAGVTLVTSWNGSVLIGNCTFAQAGSDSAGYHTRAFDNGQLNFVDNISNTLTITGTAQGFIQAKGEEKASAVGFFQHGSLVLSVDPLWPQGCLSSSRYADFYWNVDAGVTGTSSGPQFNLNSHVRVVLGTALSTVPGASLGNTDDALVNTSTTSFQFNKTIQYTTGTITLGAASSATGELNFAGTTSGVVTLSTQDAAGTWTMKLPTTAGTSNYFLQTDGSGNTTWAAAGASGTITVNSTVISGGTSGRVVYDNAGTFGEAANFTISSGQPNVPTGSSYRYNGQNVLYGYSGNWFLANAGNFTSTSTNSLAFGDTALENITTGDQIVAIGANAAQQLTTAQNCVFIGASCAGNAVVTRNSNIGEGTQALFNLTSGQNNLAEGTGALFNLTTANGNVAIGTGAGGGITVGSTYAAGGNTAIGDHALAGNCDANIAIGGSCAQACTGDANILFGYWCAADLTSGANNIVISTHNFSNSNLTTGNRNILIGNDCNLQTNTASNQLNIGSLIYGTGTGTGAGPSGGSVGINVLAPAVELDVLGQIQSGSTTSLIRSSAAVTNGAASSLGTLTNAPAAGNPSAFFAIYVNGTRYGIPAWAF